MLRTSRRSRAFALIGVALLATVLAQPAGATTPGRNGRIAFQAATDAGLQIFTVRSNGKDLQQVTHVDGDATQVDWSPDGRRLAFSVNECSIAIIDADGSNYALLAEDPDLCQTDPVFTADGQRLVYERFDFVAEVDAIWSMKTDGSDKQLLTLAGGADPNVSPDGSRVSFKAGPFGALHVQNMDGSGLHQATPDWDIAYKHDWSPDGSRIVISDNAEPGPGEPVNIATVRPDGTGLRYLTHYPGPAQANVGSYSPDGQFIVFRLSLNGQYTLYRMRTDGSDLHAILGPSEFLPRHIDWGPAPGRSFPIVPLTPVAPVALP
jgi:Tol biopolymer transport system component